MFCRCGNARSGLPRRGALEDVARNVARILEEPGEIGMTGTRAAHRAAPKSGIALLGRAIHDLPPGLPVAIANEHRDRRSDCLASAYAAKKLDLILLELHPPPSSVPSLTPRQLGIHMLGEQGQAGGDTLEDRDEGWPVGFTRGCETQHSQNIHKNEE